MDNTPKTVNALIDALGRSTLISAGFSTQTITNWKAKGLIPADKFLAIRSLGDASGVGVAEDLFGFKKTTSVKEGTTRGVNAQ